jgi:hypothetical protein
MGVWAICVSTAVLISGMLTETIYSEVWPLQAEGSNTEKGAAVVIKETSTGYARTQTIRIGYKVCAGKVAGAVYAGRVCSRNERSLVSIYMYPGSIEVDSMPGQIATVIRLKIRAISSLL